MSEKLTNARAKQKHSSGKKKLSKKQKKILILAGSGTGLVLLLAYIGFAIYFNSHFFFGTSINNINCNGKNVSEAKSAVQGYLDSFTITIHERNSKTEQIESDDFGLRSSLKTDVSELKKKQNGWTWPASIFKDYSYTIESENTYDEKKLDELISKLSCMQDQNMTEPVNASIEQSGSTFKIIPEKAGTSVDKDKVRAEILNAVEKVTDHVDLEKSGCYKEPAYTKDHEKVIDAAKELNSYAAAKITYNILGNTEVVDSKTILSWLSWNDNFDVQFNSEAVTKLVSGWGSSYNTSGKPHTLNTSYGTTVTIDKGNYGWKIDTKATSSELIQAIKNGEQSTKEPVYSSKANTQDSAKDYGNTYVEINLGTQHLYFYKDGALVVESDFVSGKVTNGNATPTGIYGLTYKQSPAVLKGPGYASPVKYWMPFNGGVGLHDASWRNKFGGNIFYSSGSHGCINLPKAAAQTIYENITAGCAIIVYDEKIDTKPLEEVPLTPAEIDAANKEQDANSAANAGITPETPEVPVDDPGNVEQPVTPVVPVTPVSTPAPTPTPVPTPAPTPTPVPTPSPVPRPSAAQ